MKIIEDFKKKWMIWHSSKFLINKMLKNIDFSKDLTLVQFWSWKAVFVKEILKRMTKNSKLYVFEIDPECEKYSKILKNDKRLFYINDSAENVSKYIFYEVDAIVSTLPFASLPKKLLFKIVNEAKKILKEKWLFLQYQYFLTDKKSIENIFSKKSKLSFTPLNFPPAFVYKIEK